MKYLLLLCMSLLVACESGPKTSSKDMINDELTVLEKSILAHGGSSYLDVNLAFDFRDRSYTMREKDGQFSYTSKFEKSGDKYNDTLTNATFSRTINGKVTELADTNVTKYSNSLNSVIYFAMLPKKLEDPAVLKYDRGKIEIKGQSYHAIEVRFNEEGGGTDFDDTFYYWINTKTHYIDYLAYDYQVDGGGVRFREAYNPQVVNGIRFQDYINYEASIGTPLAELPGLFEDGELKELSKIELENMKAI